MSERLEGTSRKRLSKMANKHEKWGSNKKKRNVNYNDEIPLPAPQEE